MFSSFPRLTNIAVIACAAVLFALPLSQTATAQQPASPPAPAAPAPTAPAQPSPEQGAPAQAAPTEQAPAAQPTAPAQAPEAPPAPSAAFPEELAQRVTQLTSAIENAEKAVERVKERESGLAEQRDIAEQIEIDAQQIATTLHPRLEAVNAQLEKLGPAPTDEGAEAQPVAAERSRLTGLQTQMGGAIKTAELSRVRARQLISRVQQLRQGIFAQDLLRRSPSILSGSTWSSLELPATRAYRQISNVVIAWWSDASAQITALLLLMIVAVGAHTALRLPLATVVRRHGYVGEAGVQPHFFSRAKSGVITFVARAAPAAAAASVIYGGLTWLNLLEHTAGVLAEIILTGILIHVGLSALANAVLMPCPPSHRLLDVPADSAPKLLRLAKLFGTVAALNFVASSVVRTLYLPLEVGVLVAVIYNLASAALLLALVRTPLVVKDPPERYVPRWLTLPLAALAVAIVITTLTGYVSLGRFITGQVVLVGSAVLIILLAHYAVRNVVYVAAEGNRGHVLEARLGLDRDQTSTFSQLLVFSFDVVIILAAIPLLLLTWGFAPSDILDWIRLALFGFEVGQFRISLARILIAVLLFLALLSVTRLIQRWLDNSVLRPARVDGAISHSVLMGIGYAGIGLATVAALSYAGLDLTHLALVAGALSVGIGFGLQAIFNNFVSGIILLIERPIKVGDWINVGGQEGFVRRINVRATEIETFDRASVIVPNSQLITGSMTNLTHRNAMGRILFKINVSYKSDPEHVLTVIRGVVDAQSSVLKLPAPWVGLDDFSPDAMVFTVVAFVADVSQRGGVKSQMLIDINKAFKEAGIEIPHPQHDIHLRDLDGVRSAVAAALEARRREKAFEAGAD